MIISSIPQLAAQMFNLEAYRPVSHPFSIILGVKIVTRIDTDL